MRRLAMGLLVALMLTVGSLPARAAYEEGTYDDSITHPLRLAAYLAHPIGFAAEWLVGRPFHYLISRPYLDRFFGYEPSDEITGSYLREIGR